MKFRIAPDWLMKLNDEDILNSSQVTEAFNFSQFDSISALINRGAIPYPDKTKPRGTRFIHFWSVGYLKNHLKLPTEINQKYSIRK